MEKGGDFQKIRNEPVIKWEQHCFYDLGIEMEFLFS